MVEIQIIIDSYAVVDGCIVGNGQGTQSWGYKPAWSNQALTLAMLKTC
jgi:hypothetical protein